MIVFSKQGDQVTVAQIDGDNGAMDVGMVPVDQFLREALRLYLDDRAAVVEVVEHAEMIVRGRQATQWAWEVLRRDNDVAVAFGRPLGSTANVQCPDVATFIEAEAAFEAVEGTWSIARHEDVEDAEVYRFVYLHGLCARLSCSGTAAQVEEVLNA